jgi:hypothetical protein
MRLPLACVAASLVGTLAASPVLAAPKVDVVVLQNGTRVVGEIKSMSKGRLELATDDMGTVYVEWDKIAQVTAPEFFEVEDMGGRLYFGSLRPGRAEGTVDVATDWAENSLLLRGVARIQLVKSSFWTRFRGSVDLGASYTSATELLQLDGTGDLRYRSTKYEVSADASGVLTHQPEVEDTRRSSFALGYARLFANRHRVYARGTLEQNRELGFDLRSSVLGGWGYMLARDARNELLGAGGIALNREKPLEGETTTNVEAAAGLSWANFAYDFPNTDIQVGAFGYLGLSQWGRFRLEANASLRREVFANFYVGLKAYESYDSRPATKGAQKNDWGLSLTFGYTF